MRTTLVTRFLWLTLHVTAPIPIPIAKSRCAAPAPHRPRRWSASPRSMHERHLGMRRGSEDLHASGGQLNDEHGVARDEASPRPDFLVKKIAASGAAPVHFPKRLTRRRAGSAAG